MNTSKRNPPWLVVIPMGFLVLLFGLAVGSGALTPDDPLITAIIVGILVAAFFGTWLLVRGIKGDRKIIGIYIVAMAMLTELSLRPPRVEGEPGSRWEAFLHVAVWGGGALLGLSHFKKLFSFRTDSPVFWLIVFTGWAIASTVYAHSPLYTLAFSLQFASYMLISAMISEHLTEVETLRYLAFGTGALTVISVALLAISPHTVQILLPAEGIRFRGLTASPNGMAEVASLFFILVCVLRRQGWVSMPVVIGTILVVAIAIFSTRSRGSIVAASLAIIWIFTSRKTITFALFAGAVVTVCGAFYFLNFGNLASALSALTRSGRIQELYTVSNRSDIWAYALRKIADAPVIGYGYCSTRTMMPEDYFTTYGFTVTSVHNLMLQVLITTGVIGAIPIVTVLVMSAIAMFRAPNPFRDAMFIYVVLQGLTEASALGAPPNLTTCFWIMSIFLSTAVSRDLKSVGSYETGAHVAVGV